MEEENMQEGLEVAGSSRSGQVPKKSSKLSNLWSPDNIKTRLRKLTPVKTYSEVEQDEPVEFQDTPQRNDEGTASGSKSDFYVNNPDTGDSMESDSSAPDEGSARAAGKSRYMMEKSKKKSEVKDGRVVGRAKAQRKDKDLEVAGSSRSGQVPKRSLNFKDFKSPDTIKTKLRKLRPVKTYSEVEQDEPVELQDTPQRNDEGTASGSKSDFHVNNPDTGDSMESDSSAPDEGSARTAGKSRYMMEKSKSRKAANMRWAEEARNKLLKKHPRKDPRSLSKLLRKMWDNLNSNEHYAWGRIANRIEVQQKQGQGAVSKMISNPSSINTIAIPSGSGLRPSQTPTKPPETITPPQQALEPVSSGSRYSASSSSAINVAAHRALLGEILTNIVERL